MSVQINTTRNIVTGEYTITVQDDTGNIIHFKLLNKAALSLAQEILNLEESAKKRKGEP